MKRILALAVLAVLAFGVSASAQHYNNNRFGIVGGLTSSSTDIGDISTKTISKYHLGIAGEFPLGGGFALQPGAVFQVKGISLDRFADASGKEIAESFETKVGYIEIPVQIQWGPDLMLFRPYGFLEPFAGYRLKEWGNAPVKVEDEFKEIEYGLGAGVGLELGIFQISAKYFHHFASDIKGLCFSAAIFF